MVIEATFLQRNGRAVAVPNSGAVCDIQDCRSDNDLRSSIDLDFDLNPEISAVMPDPLKPSCYAEGEKRLSPEIESLSDSRFVLYTGDIPLPMAPLIPEGHNTVSVRV